MPDQKFSRTGVIPLGLRRLLLPALLLASLSSASVFAAEIVRSVSVSGQGKVVAEPDRATLVLGAETHRPQLDVARKEVGRIMESLLALTRELKLDQKLVRSTRLNVQPEFVWNEKTRRNDLSGYVVSRQLEVDLRDLDKLGILLERAVSAGANTVNEPQLDSSRRGELEREALAKAVEDARLNAAVLATSAGARLGAVKSLNASAGMVMPMVQRSFGMKTAAMESADAGAATYQAGQMTFNANVQAEFDLDVSAR